MAAINIVLVGGGLVKVLPGQFYCPAVRLCWDGERIADPELTERGKGV